MHIFQIIIYSNDMIEKLSKAKQRQLWHNCKNEKRSENNSSRKNFNGKMKREVRYDTSIHTHKRIKGESRRGKVENVKSIFNIFSAN